MIDYRTILTKDVREKALREKIREQQDEIEVYLNWHEDSKLDLLESYVEALEGFIVQNMPGREDVFRREEQK